MDLAKRIRALVFQAQQMHKLDPRFGCDPIKPFIDALATDLYEISGAIDEGGDAQHLKHHLTEVCGTIDEYCDRPCRSLRERMRAASHAAQKAAE